MKITPGLTAASTAAAGLGIGGAVLYQGKAARFQQEAETFKSEVTNVKNKLDECEKSRKADQTKSEFVERKLLAYIIAKDSSTETMRIFTAITGKEDVTRLVDMLRTVFTNFGTQAHSARLVARHFIFATYSIIIQMSGLGKDIQDNLLRQVSEITTTVERDCDAADKDKKWREDNTFHTTENWQNTIAFGSFNTNIPQVNDKMGIIFAELKDKEILPADYPENTAENTANTAENTAAKGSGTSSGNQRRRYRIPYSRRTSIHSRRKHSTKRSRRVSRRGKRGRRSRT